MIKDECPSCTRREIKIGDGAHGNSWTVIFGIGERVDISHNHSSFIIDCDIPINTSEWFIVMKDTEEGKIIQNDINDITVGLDTGIDPEIVESNQNRLFKYIRWLIVTNLKPSEIIRAIESSYEYGHDKGMEDQQRKIQEALGLTNEF